MRMQSSDGSLKCELFVEDSLELDLPVVLCLHSLFLDGRMFSDFVEAAVGRYRVVRPDFIGQGRSPESSLEVIDMDRNAADILALLDELQLNRVHILAQSMGGDVAFRVAHRRPEAVISMAILGSSACAEPPEQLAQFRRWVTDAMENGFREHVLDYTMTIMIGSATLANPDRVDAVEETRARIAALTPSLKPAMVGVVERASVEHLLNEIDCPVLIVSGELDKPRPPAWSDRMHADLPNSRLWRLEGIGHSPIIESPEIVIPELLSFFDDCS